MSISKRFFIIATVLLIFSCISTTKNFACLGKTIEELCAGTQLPPEVPKTAELSDSFYINEGLGVFRFVSKKNHYDMFIDWEKSETFGIRAYIDGEWKFWKYDQRGIPQPCSEKRFFELTESLRNRKK